MLIRDYDFTQSNRRGGTRSVLEIDQQSPFWFLGRVNKVGFSQIAARETFSMEVLHDAREVLFYCVQCMDA